MLITINDIPTMGRYTSSVMAKIRHHAPHIRRVVAHLLWEVVTYGTDIQVSARANGKLGNVIWFKSKKTGDQFHCRHEYGVCVELRRNSAQGRIVATFNNDSDLDAMSIVFANL
jgi:uncharacterized protein (DUF1330 family)